ncbi:hypothetical protein P8C59_005989 [Phyllachora maydis]|uniref:Box C/D snoRNA protein 1 n=1 Tax=Phyllachora maydis TaxID=1825666 RepID=A0AAD9I5X9_9PEZI|nr:hypothetical protein P8C59_005989 [Phyllachora maydis]
MSDPLLSSLCTICHAAPPRYKCPRCAARTCSLPCSQKHKARASCSGARDPSAYVAPARLRTPAGFDHDYNFLHGIEVARGRSEREIVERRALLREQELRPPGDDARNYEKVWHGDELHHVPVVEPQRAGPGSHGRRGGSGAQAQTVSRFDVHVRRRVRALNIELLMMPEGMTRHKENKTGWNRRTSSIHWQVEWLLFDRSSEMSPRRILHKALDGMPANMALARSLEWQRAGDLKRQHEEVDAADDGEEPAKKKQAWKKKKKASKSHASFAQDFLTSSWDYVEYTLQSFYSTQWDHTSSVASVPRTADDDALDFLSWRFFLHKADRPKQLIPLASTESLASALAGRAIAKNGL